VRGHPSHNAREALYYAMLEKLPNPFVFQNDGGNSNVDAPPAGTPRSITPEMGDRRGWYVRTWKVVRQVEDKFSVVCSTYTKHGTTGRPLGIDIWVAPMGQRATSAQEAYGDRIVNFLINNEDRVGLDYIIWWNRIRRNGRQWIDYTRWSKPASQGGWPHGSADQQTRRHEDHVHVQVF
jgi:hypothetical protein